MAKLTKDQVDLASSANDSESQPIAPGSTGADGASNVSENTKDATEALVRVTPHLASIDALFETNVIPTFKGETFDDHVGAYQALRHRDRTTCWQKAAIAASLKPASGRRTGDQTPIKEFSDAVGIGDEYCSRLRRTHAFWSAADLTDPLVKSLLAEMSFKHAMVAATTSADWKQAKVNLREARDQGWTADEFGRHRARIKNTTIFSTVDGQPIRGEDDDEDPDVAWKGLPETPRKKPSGRSSKLRRPDFEFTPGQREALRQTLPALSILFNTVNDDPATFVALAVHGYAEWIEGGPPPMPTPMENSDKADGLRDAIDRIKPTEPTTPTDAEPEPHPSEVLPHLSKQQAHGELAREQGGRCHECGEPLDDLGSAVLQPKHRNGRTMVLVHQACSHLPVTGAVGELEHQQ
jgi:hypothetical protein